MTEASRIATNLRTLRILEILGTSDRPMTPTQINARLGLPKQSIHRLCKTLVDEGFLTSDAVTKGLRPARRLREMATGILFTSRFHIARHQVLEEVAAKVSETVNFAVPATDGMTYIDRVETDWPFRVQLPIGTHVPFHCTASGKTFLASLPAKNREKMVASLELTKLTPNTHDTPESLLQELLEIRKRGYALDNEEFVQGMVAIAVPVTDDEGRYIASLAFHGPVQRLSISDAIARHKVILKGAEKLRATLMS